VDPDMDAAAGIPQSGSCEADPLVEPSVCNGISAGVACSSGRASFVWLCPRRLVSILGRGLTCGAAGGVRFVTYYCSVGCRLRIDPLAAY
jgi:hypothetical protein